MHPDVMQQENCIRPGAEVHTYNPNYSGGKDQEDHGSRTAQAKS
jgi:hypothetical protein